MISLFNLQILIPVHWDHSSFYNGLLLILNIHLEGGWSPLDTCPIPPLKEMQSELQAILILFRCYSAINAIDIIGAGHSMQRWWVLPWEVSPSLSTYIGYSCFPQFMLPSQWQDPFSFILGGSRPRDFLGLLRALVQAPFQAISGFPAKGSFAGLAHSLNIVR